MGKGTDWTRNSGAGWWASPMPQFAETKAGYTQTGEFSIYRRRFQFRVRETIKGWTAELWGCNYTPNSLGRYVVRSTGENAGSPFWKSAKEAKAACFTAALREGWRGTFEPLANANVTQAHFATDKEQEAFRGEGGSVHDPEIPPLPVSP